MTFQAEKYYSSDYNTILNNILNIKCDMIINVNK